MPSDDAASRDVEHLAKATGGQLIAGARVAGCAVFDHAFDKLGTIDDIMIDKATGQVAFAVLAYGGWGFGIGEKHYPLPWHMLHYDTKVQGYVVTIDAATLQAAPAYDTAAAALEAAGKAPA